MDYLLERKRQDPLDFLQPIKVAQNALLSSQPFHNLDINTLLHQTGYLTIRAVDTDGRLVLGFPNREVESSMANLYRQLMVNDAEEEPLNSHTSLLTLLNQGDAAPVVEYLNTVFNPPRGSFNGTGKFYLKRPSKVGILLSTHAWHARRKPRTPRAQTITHLVA